MKFINRVFVAVLLVAALVAFAVLGGAYTQRQDPARIQNDSRVRDLEVMEAVFRGQLRLAGQAHDVDGLNYAMRRLNEIQDELRVRRTR